MSQTKFIHSPEIYVLDLIRTRSFVPLPEQCYIDIAMTYYAENNNNDAYFLSYSGKVYHLNTKGGKKNFMITVDQTKTYPISWHITKDKNTVELIPFGAASYDYNFLRELIDNYYNDHYSFMKKDTQTDGPSRRPFSQRERDHLGLTVPIRV